MRYDCEIEYRAGDKISHVDVLADEGDVLHTLDILNDTKDDWITRMQSADSEIRHIREVLEDPETAKIASVQKGYRMKSGRVLQ